MEQVIIYGLILLAGALVSGLIANRIATGRRTLSFFLVFTGGFLFSITIVHLLPEIYNSGLSSFRIGALVLIGFFIQQFLEFFTSGVEHGHIHELKGEHSHGRFYAPAVVIALCIHSLLEGGILVHESMQSIFVGVLLHKIPAAFALVTILKIYSNSKRAIIVYLLIFSVASPVGSWFGTLLSEEVESVLMAIVAGNFLQISTTIVFENTADHKFNLRKLLYSLSGAVLAVVAEMFFF